jgi:hypothetical protein
MQRMADDRPRVKFITALAADDIRREASGKEILIGVYNANIIIGTAGPDQGLILAISVLLETPVFGEIPIVVQVIGPGGDALGQVTAMIQVTDITISGQFTSFSATGLPVSLPNPGEITIRAKQYDDEWQTIRVIRVIVNPEAPGLQSPVPSVASIARLRPSSPPQPAAPASSSPPERASPARPTRPRRS